MKINQFVKAALVFAIAALIAVPLGLRITNAQVSTIVGQVVPNNYLAPTAGAQMAIVGGVTTNPASNFIIQVASGQVYCGGAASELAQVQLTLQASSTYLVVYNCSNQQAYAKTAVTGPGSSGTSVGVPATILQPVFGVEIPVATVVCNATACGNGGNGSITDARVPGQWLLGGVQGGHVFNPLTNGDTDFLATLVAGTVTKTFAAPFQSVPVCVGTPTATGTFTTTATLKIAPTTTTAVITSTTGTDTAVIQVHCAGNPN